MYHLKSLFLIIILTLFTSCQEPDPVSPIEKRIVDNSLQKGNNTVKVMTRNIYVGTDVDRILMEKDPNQIPIRCGCCSKTSFARASALSGKFVANSF
jgi:hypothetical protein